MAIIEEDKKRKFRLWVPKGECITVRIGTCTVRLNSFSDMTLQRYFFGLDKIKEYRLPDADRPPKREGWWVTDIIYPSVGLVEVRRRQDDENSCCEFRAEDDGTWIWSDAKDYGWEAEEG